MATAQIGFAFYEVSKTAEIKSWNPIDIIMQKHQTYWHVEVAFPKHSLPSDHPKKHTGDPSQVVAYGIMARDSSDRKKPGKVFEMDRFFTSENYKFDWFQVPIKGVLNALNFAQKQVGKPYDKDGHKRILFSPRPSTVDSKSWYCTNLAAAIGQLAVPALDGIHPGCCSTDELKEKLAGDAYKTFRFNPSISLKEKTENDRLRRELRGQRTTKGSGIMRGDPNENYAKVVKHYS